MTVAPSKRSVYLVAEDLGDWTSYNVSLAELDNAVQVTLGGASPPFVGGVVPNHMIESFNRLVLEWAHGVIIRHPQDAIFSWLPFIHFQGKQVKVYYNKWDLAVAIIFAWLFYWKKEQNEEATLIIGHLYNNEKEQANRILEKVMQIAY